MFLVAPLGLVTKKVKVLGRVMKIPTVFARVTMHVFLVFASRLMKHLGVQTIIQKVFVLAGRIVCGASAMWTIPLLAPS